ncbi:MAG: AtpZ/AtpI family protein [Bacteriovoracaceae bacterium]|nr:AtpZ/AtpI family protein [Bacteroidota bacterium]
MKNEENNAAGMIRSVAPYLTLGIQIAAAVVLFLFVGKYADDVLGTKPWLMVAGIVVGFAGGMIHFFREVVALSNKEEHERITKN